jgi:RNA polymerase sigma-70 factor (ECF subfamily)
MKSTMERAVAQTGSAEHSSDEGLIERASRGDREAFAVLVETRTGWAFRIAAAILGGEADAHDVVQEAFVSAWVHLPHLRDTDHFDAWLNRIIRNGCRDTLRRRHRVRELTLDAAARLSSEDEYFDMTALNRAFERLTVDQRQLLVLHHLGHQPVTEIARQLGIPVGTAKWRLHRARRALERELEVER